MVQWVEAQARTKVATKKQKHPHLWRSPQRTPNRKRKIFFSASTRRLAESVEGVNSSLALAAGDSWPKNCEPIYWLARSLKGFNGKEMRHFCCEKAAFFKFFGLHLEFDFAFENFFRLRLDLDQVLKNQDCIC